MPIGIRVVAEGDAILVLELDEARHGVWAGAIHADFAVVVDRHEARTSGSIRGFTTVMFSP